VGGAAAGAGVNELCGCLQAPLHFRSVTTKQECILNKTVYERCGQRSGSAGHRTSGFSIIMQTKNIRFRPFRGIERAAEVVTFVDPSIY